MIGGMTAPAPALATDPAALQHLEQLGALAPLPAEIARDLDERGVCIVPNVLDEATLERLRMRHDELIRKEGADVATEAASDPEFHKERGAPRLADLCNKGTVFDQLWLHPLVVAAAYHVIARPFKLSALSSREARAGQGNQGLHADWGDRGDPSINHVFIAVWSVDAFMPDNGSTRVVPGSHRQPHPSGILADVSLPHPQQLVATCPAGSVILMNSHTWHGGTTNTSGMRRRACHAYYCAREHGQQLDQREYLRKRTWDRLTPAQRWLLDV
jgi:ectoine hydroxylase-related dioxygenase (phytanoyl-CoA dioxygenase family)